MRVCFLGVRGRERGGGWKGKGKREKEQDVHHIREGHRGLFGYRSVGQKGVCRGTIRSDSAAMRRDALVEVLWKGKFIEGEKMG